MSFGSNIRLRFVLLHPVRISPSRWLRSTLSKIALSIAILRSGAVLREIVIDGAVVELELVKHRAVEPSRASSVNLGAVFVFLVLSFPCSIFQTPENIFRKIFWNTTKHIKTFFFPENSISGKWNIFRKCFYANQTQPKFFYLCHSSHLFPTILPPHSLALILFIIHYLTFFFTLLIFSINLLLLLLHLFLSHSRNVLLPTKKQKWLLSFVLSFSFFFLFFFLGEILSCNFDLGWWGFLFFIFYIDEFNVLTKLVYFL